MLGKKNYSLPYKNRGMGQQNTYHLSEKPGENPRHNTSDIKHYRVLIAQTEPTAKGTKFRDLKGEKTQTHSQLLFTVCKNIQRPKKIQCSPQHAYRRKANISVSTGSIVIQVTQAIFDDLQGDLICLTENVI